MRRHVGAAARARAQSLDIERELMAQGFDLEALGVLCDERGWRLGIGLEPDLAFTLRVFNGPFTTRRSALRAPADWMLPPAGVLLATVHNVAMTPTGVAAAACAARACLHLDGFAPLDAQPA